MINLPVKATLKKYGLSSGQWLELYEQGNGCCWICKRPFFDTDKKLRNSYIDHEHVKNYKNLPPEEKRKYIRGLLCFQCNRIMVQKSNTTLKLRAALKYLIQYELRKGSTD